MNRIRMMVAGLTLLVCAPGLAQPVMPAPDGSGDPLAISCRQPQQLPGSRLFGPKVCKTNAEWARYRKDGMDVAADGIHDVASERYATVNRPTCNEAPGGPSGSTTMAMQTNFSRVCF